MSNKKKKINPEQGQQIATQYIQEYFTKEVNNRISEMTNERMFTLLRQLEQSEFWYAILRYNNLRLLTAQSALNSLDPVTSPSAISRTQGSAIGLCDLQNAVIQLVEMEKDAIKEKESGEIF